MPNAATDLPLLPGAAGATLTEQLAQRFADRIVQRLLPPGARLPSVRACAQRHQVSASTVVGAYDLLQAQGLVVARPQRGFFVREAAAAAPPRARAGPSPCRPARPSSTRAGSSSSPDSSTRTSTSRSTAA